MIKDFALAGLTLSLITCGGWLLGQGAQLNKARKALEHERAVSAVLAADLVAQKEAVKVEIVTRKVYIKAEQVKNEIDSETRCDAVVSVWRNGINGLRQEALADSATATSKP
jgi:hypothetical protein